MKMIDLAKQAKQASIVLAQFGNLQKNQALLAIAAALETQTEEILTANRRDIDYAISQGISDVVIDFLLLTPERIKTIADDVRNMVKLSDPVGQIIDGGVLAEHLCKLKVTFSESII